MTAPAETSVHIDANDLEAMAKQRPDDLFLKGSGVPKLTGAIRKLEQELARARELNITLGRIMHDMVTAEQAAWIEWRHGAGADAAMRWIHNGLVGPGHIPDENEPYGKEPQAWFDANVAEPLPYCFCGRPSNILWMGQGFCCNTHYQQAKAEQEGGAA